MSTASEREAALRRALLSAAEQIEPAPGGLERIQQRLGRPRPVLIARGEAAWTVVQMRAPDVIEALRRRASNAVRLVWDRFGPNSAQGSGPPWLRWLRPLVAMSVAVFVVGAGVYIGLDAPLGTQNTNGSSPRTLGDTGSHPGGSGRGVHGTTLGNGSQPGESGTLSTSASPSACRSSTPHFGAKGATSSPPSASTTPTATTTTPSTGTSSSSPAPSSSSPSDSSSPATGDSGAAPDAGLASGDPAGASDGTSQSTTDSSRRAAGAAQSAPSPATSGISKPSSSSKKFNPCHPKKPKAKHKKTSTASTSAKLSQTQPGKTYAAKLD